MSADKVYVLRTCAADMTSSGGRFTWPESGPVEAPDWTPEPRCGGGLHGLLWGEGDGDLLNWSPDARWLVVEVDAADVVDLGGKVKFPRGTVVHAGDRLSATADIIARGATGAVVGAVVAAGDRGTAGAGDQGTATAGYGGTLVIRWWDGQRHRLSTGYVGEDGIEAGVAYRLDEAGKFVKANVEATS